MTSPAAYEHAIVPLRSTASSASSLRSQSHAGRLAGEHVGAGVVDPHVEAAELARAPRATRRSHASRVPRSACATSARPPRAGDRVGDLAGALGRRAVRRAGPSRPRAANVSAMARPMPLLAPVTTACRPASRPAAGGWIRRGGSVLHAAGERMARRLGRIGDRAHARLALQRARDRLLGRLVVVVEDLLVVRGFPVDEDADDDAEVVDVALGDDALADRVDDGARRPPPGRGRTSARPASRPSS